MGVSLVRLLDMLDYDGYLSVLTLTNIPNIKKKRPSKVNLFISFY